MKPSIRFLRRGDGTHIAVPQPVPVNKTNPMSPERRELLAAAEELSLAKRAAEEAATAYDAAVARRTAAVQRFDAAVRAYQ